jgi:hypothetical protein
MMGSGVMMVIAPESIGIMANILLLGIGLNLLTIGKEILLPHDTPDTKEAIRMMTKGFYSKYFWRGIIVGNLIPVILIILGWPIVAGALALVGIFLTEYVRIRVPQMIPLS